MMPQSDKFIVSDNSILTKYFIKEYPDACLIGLTRYLATYWAEQGVRSNALSSGGVFNGQNDVFVQKLTSLIPLGRMANHDEYRSAVKFLCSDASEYMNGQNIVMDGGRSVL